MRQGLLELHGRGEISGSNALFPTTYLVYSTRPITAYFANTNSRHGNNLQGSKSRENNLQCNHPQRKPSSPYLSVSAAAAKSEPLQGGGQSAPTVCEDGVELGSGKLENVAR